MQINMFKLVGDFGEDKDAAADLREKQIKPALDNGNEVVIDFGGVTLVTQSFIHALISEILRSNGESALDFLDFKNCSGLVQGIIATVVQYSLETLTDLENVALEAEMLKDEIEKKQQYEQMELFKQKTEELGCDQNEEALEVPFSSLNPKLRKED